MLVGGTFITTSTPENAAKCVPFEVAKALGRIVRFAGATDEPISVLQHVLAGARFAAAKWNDQGRMALLFLVHDATEAIVGEVPYGFKPKEFSDLEDLLATHLCRGWNIDLPNPEEQKALKWLDKNICKDEGYEYGLKGYEQYSKPSGDMMLRRIVREIKETFPFSRTSSDRNLWAFYHEIVTSKDMRMLDMLEPGKAV